MLLMEEAERIALEEHGSNKIAVISGNVNHHHRNGGNLAFSLSPSKKPAITDKFANFTHFSAQKSCF